MLTDQAPPPSVQKQDALRAGVCACFACKYNKIPFIIHMLYYYCLFLLLLLCDMMMCVCEHGTSYELRVVAPSSRDTEWHTVMHGL